MKDYFSDLPKSYNTTDRVANSSPPAPIPGSQASIPLNSQTAILMSITDITKESIRCFTDYAKCREHEKTERKRIKATLRAIQYQIDAQKEIYLKELDKNYEERNRLYDIAEKTQKKALELNDKEMLQLCFNLILDVYNKPFDINIPRLSLSNGSINL